MVADLFAAICGLHKFVDVVPYHKNSQHPPGVLPPQNLTGQASMSIWDKIGLDDTVESIMDSYSISQNSDLNKVQAKFLELREGKVITHDRIIRDIKEHFAGTFTLYKLNPNEIEQFCKFVSVTGRFITFDSQLFVSHITTELAQAINSYVISLFSRIEVLIDNPHLRQITQNLVNFRMITYLDVKVLSAVDENADTIETQGATVHPNPDYFRRITQDYAAPVHNIQKTYKDLSEFKLSWFTQKNSGFFQIPLQGLKITKEVQFDDFLRSALFKIYLSLIGGELEIQSQFNLNSTLVIPDWTIKLPDVLLPTELKLIKLGDVWKLDTNKNKDVVTQLLLSMLAANCNTDFLINPSIVLRVTVIDPYYAKRDPGFELKFDHICGDNLNIVSQFHLLLQDADLKPLTEGQRSALTTQLLIQRG